MQPTPPDLEKKIWRGLYLFAGLERQADIKHYLNLEAEKRGVQLCMEEWDILRNKDQDLTRDDTWSAVKDKLLRGVFDFVIVAPPCNTFSRARHNRSHPGPKPIRSRDYPRGFPWLKKSDQATVDQANLLVERAIEACRLAHESGAVFLLEHPEQLGMASGLIPASIWDWIEFKQLEEATHLLQLAIFQCDFQAETSKPTRLATNAISACDESPLGKFRGPPVLDDLGQYLGPLPQQCAHGSHKHKLIGKAADGSWNTGPAAAYPPRLCEEIALLLVNHFLTLKEKGGVAEAKVQEDRKEEMAEVIEPLGFEAAETDDEDTFHGKLEQAARDNGGLPLVCGWQNRPKSFCDGGGLCSPGRWRPKDRGLGIQGERKTFIDNLALLVRGPSWCNGYQI